jgi:Xaa-Pro dipeptidase
MTSLTRRRFLGCATAGAAVAGSLGSSALAAGPTRREALRPMTEGARPIGAEEYAARLGRLGALMRRDGIPAILIEAGSSLQYFTGIHWWRSERTTAAVVTADGAVVVVTPFFEEPSIRESLKVPADVRTWQEDESPFDLLAAALRDHRTGDGRFGVEGTTRFFIIDQVRQSLGAGAGVVSADELVRACRRVKSPAELALMQVANDVTLAAIRHVHASLRPGMTGSEIAKLVNDTTVALGGSDVSTLVLLNEASAFPHGSSAPQVLRAGSVVLVDTGCNVHGYVSDISRTWVFGTPTARQRDVWNTVKRGQEIALETAKVGVPVGDVDRAVRAHYEGLGWSKNYRLPGTSHRTGHGIGMDGHESPFLVRSDTTPLEPGMCFSDEPGIYIPGEFGIRLEDCWYMTAAGPRLFTPLAASIDHPV